MVVLDPSHARRTRLRADATQSSRTSVLVGARIPRRRPERGRDAGTVTACARGSTGRSAIRWVARGSTRESRRSTPRISRVSSAAPPRCTFDDATHASVFCSSHPARSCAPQEGFRGGDEDRRVHCRRPRRHRLAARPPVLNGPGLGSSLPVGALGHRARVRRLPAEAAAVRVAAGAAAAGE